MMPKEQVILFSDRLKEYIQNKEIKDIYIVFHGGEPLLVGEDRLLEYINIVNDKMKGLVRVHYSVQTNGTLITERFIKKANIYGLKFSLSLDGPQHIHDKNRLPWRHFMDKTLSFEYKRIFLFR